MRKKEGSQASESEREDLALAAAVGNGGERETKIWVEDRPVDRVQAQTQAQTGLVDCVEKRRLGGNEVSVPVQVP